MNVYYFTFTGHIPGIFLKDPADDNWQDLIITHMKDGGIFWAQIGERAITTVAEIQAILNTGGLERKERVIKGEHLVVFGDIQGISCYLRAQVGSVFSVVCLAIATDKTLFQPQSTGPSCSKRR